jgi:Protein of unknown function (DUF3078)
LKITQNAVFFITKTRVTNMRKLVMTVALLSAAAVSLAQTGMQDMQAAAAREVKKEGNAKGLWSKGGIFTFAVAQGGSQNWASGAEKFSLSVNSFLNLYANRSKGRKFWDNNLTASYGMLNTESQGVRKNDDRIDLYSKWGYQLKKKFALSVIGNFRTQFSDGFDYNYLGNGLKRRTSGLFAPASVLIAPGAEWRPCKSFNVFLSPASARWMIVTNAPYSYYYDATNGQKPDGSIETPLANFYNVDPTRNVRFDLGAFASINFSKEICKNLFYITRADLYSDYLNRRPDNVDVFWINAFTFKVNKFINVTYNLDIVYDDDVKQTLPNGKPGNSVGTQIRSLLGVGFAAKF